jgi:hypothetical protein
MGIWFISSFIANLGGGLVASKVEAIASGAQQLFWYRWFKFGGEGDFYFLFVFTSVAAAITILIFTPMLKRMMRSRTD